MNRLPLSRRRRIRGQPRINGDDLVSVTVAGQVTDSLMRSTPYRIGQDGGLRVLPGPGGIVLSHRVGDRCVGLAADHIEPGAAIRNDRGGGERGNPSAGLLTLACIGNTAVVLDGPCAGRRGCVTGKHGGVDHVLIDFPSAVLRRLQIGDRVQIHARGAGMRLLDHPEIIVMNCSVRLLRSWDLETQGHRLVVPVTHLIPAAIMGSGLGRNNSHIGDCDIQLFDIGIVRQFRLDRLRFGDLVAIVDADHRFGRSFRTGAMTIGVVIHSDSTVSGHGPGVTTLLTGEARQLVPRRDPRANLAEILNLRELPLPRPHAPLMLKDRAWTHPPPRCPRCGRPGLRRLSPATASAGAGRLLMQDGGFVNRLSESMKGASTDDKDEPKTTRPYSVRRARRDRRPTV
jgi:hypothetical protein